MGHRPRWRIFFKRMEVRTTCHQVIRGPVIKYGHGLLNKGISGRAGEAKCYCLWRFSDIYPEENCHRKTNKMPPFSQNTHGIIIIFPSLRFPFCGLGTIRGFSISLISPFIQQLEVETTSKRMQKTKNTTIIISPQKKPNIIFGEDCDLHRVRSVTGCCHVL